MNLTLPPERDLSAHRLREMEVELVAFVENRAPRRTSHRWLAPVAAAVAVLAVVGAAVGFSTFRHGDADRATVAFSPPHQRVVTPADEREILTGCAASLKSWGSAVDPLAGGHIYSLAGSAAKGTALIHTPRYVMACEIGGKNTKYQVANETKVDDPAFLNWLPTPFVIDTDLTLTSFKNKELEGSAHAVLGGRISSNVKDIVLAVGGSRTRLTIENGTFVAAITYTVHRKNPNNAEAEPLPLKVLAYDADGHLLKQPQKTTCMRTPGGHVVDIQRITTGSKSTSLTNCPKAVRWQTH